MFKSKQSPTPTITDKQMISIKLMTNYTTICSQTCLEDFNVGLAQSEKKCLAKCLDRAADFLKLAQKKVDSTTKKG
jgi:hypothetical protein